MEIFGKNLEGSLRDYHKFRATKKQNIQQTKPVFLD